MVSEVQFEELLGIVDHHAGRRHSTTGTVATALRAVLARHEQMVRESMGFICDPCKAGDHDKCEGKTRDKTWCDHQHRDKPGK